MNKNELLQRFRKIKEFYISTLGSLRNEWSIGDKTEEVNKFEKDLEEYLKK